MAVSEILVRSGGGRFIGRHLEKIMRALFGVSGAGAVAIALGALCGFPVGAKALAGLCRHGEISKQEAQKVLCICNYPSSAFMLTAVGVSLWDSAAIGRGIYICVLLSGAIWGILHRKKEIAPSAPSLPRSEPIDVSLIGEAVTSAALSLLYVCAYVTFFSCVVGCLSRIFAASGAHANAVAVVYSFFELTSGAAAASLLPNKAAGLILTAAAAGWSGISVHLQVISIFSSEKISISFRKYFAAKAVQSLLCSALVGIWLFFS